MAFEPVPPGRRVHYTRIFGTNRKGAVLSDMWVDMERIDRWSSTTKENGHWQEIEYRLQWFDKPGDPDPPEDRKTRIVKAFDFELYPPEQYPNGPDEWVPIDVVTQFEAKRGDRTIQYKLVNDAESDSRVIEWRRIVHYDTNWDTRAQAAADANPSLKKYYISVEESPDAPYDIYVRDPKTKDTGQWAETEVVLKHESKASGMTGYVFNATTKTLQPTPTSSSGSDQDLQMKFNNQYLIDNSQVSQLAEHPWNSKGVIDPFQNIVNTQLRTTQIAVLGEGTTRYLEGMSDYLTESSKDGFAWFREDADGNPRFGPNTFNVASGLGFTVAVSNGQFVVFGKPEKGEACFIKANGSNISRAVLNDRGELEWSSVASTPNDVEKLSFAGGKFFASYANDDSTSLLLSVSSDGENWSSGIGAFKSVPYDGTVSGFGHASSSVGGGSVAYDPVNKIYCSVGSYLRWGSADIRILADDPEPLWEDLFENNFMWSTSRDGHNWSAGYDTSFCYAGAFGGVGSGGGVGCSSGGTPTVTWGAGKFVASTEDKFARTYATYGPHGTLTTQPEPACAVSISTDGQSWATSRLPGARQEPDQYYGALLPDSDNNRTPLIGFSGSVQFYRTGGADNNGNPKGFFLLQGNEVQSGFHADTSIRDTVLWRSVDGESWTKVRHAVGLDGEKIFVALSAANKNPGKLRLA